MFFFYQIDFYLQETFFILYVIQPAKCSTVIPRKCLYIDGRHHLHPFQKDLVNIQHRTDLPLLLQRTDTRSSDYCINHTIHKFKSTYEGNSFTTFTVPLKNTGEIIESFTIQLFCFTNCKHLILDKKKVEVSLSPCGYT